MVETSVYYVMIRLRQQVMMPNEKAYAKTRKNVPTNAETRPEWFSLLIVMNEKIKEE